MPSLKILGNRSPEQSPKTQSRPHKTNFIIFQFEKCDKISVIFIVRTQYFFDNVSFGIFFFDSVKVDQFVLLPILFTVFTVDFFEESWAVSTVVLVTPFKGISVAKSIRALTLFQSGHPFTLISKIGLSTLVNSNQKKKLTVRRSLCKCKRLCLVFCPHAIVPYKHLHFHKCTCLGRASNRSHI